MTTMAEIEKAIDEFEQAARVMEMSYWYKCDMGTFRARALELKSKREHLMQLIREVSNE
jgi:hypothetical protein